MGLKTRAKNDSAHRSESVNTLSNRQLSPHRVYDTRIFCRSAQQLSQERLRTGCEATHGGVTNRIVWWLFTSIGF